VVSFHVPSTVGGFLLGIPTGAAVIGLHDGDAGTSLWVGLSAALTTYCVFNGAAVTLLREGAARRTLILAVAHALTGLAAATGGVVVAVEMVS
jgi:fluoride ion exporter CrcB/FEX